ncbi:MAG: chromosome segregation protein SMC [Actinomycetota bacterium]|nr:chromosome segregation protein SMC [Actinomycetota bacterium]
MFLKSLTLKGFKSFAEATTLEFQTGLTVVVGPNGSGKSNVVDAVAWVLGAQGPRTLRSSRMEDVIFAGSANRAPLGRAEVSLTIDNSARALPVELSEVTVTRTLFRNGESEYAINGGPCRLLDVQELLSDAGVGRQQHVIVSQGHLEAVLDSRPEGRRTLIEEAAGVHKYRRRREKAERRLEGTEEDLVRLQDLLREVRRQLRSLERQASTARRQRALAEERDELRRYVLGHELASLRADLDAVTGARAELAASGALLEEATAGLDAELSAAESPSSVPGDDSEDDLVAFERLRGRARGLSALLDERRRRIQSQLADDLDDRVRSLESERAALEEDLRAVDTSVGALGPRADELRAAEATVAAERAAFEQEWQEELPYPGARAGEVRGELLALRDAVARTGAEVHRAEEHSRALEGRDAELADQVAGARLEVAEAERQIEGLAAAQEAGDERLQRLQAALAEVEAHLGRARQEQRLWAARAEALASVTSVSDLGGAGADGLAGLDGALGALADVVAVEEGWDSAFEAAVGWTASAVVVDGAGTARAALAHAREEHLGATLLALGAGGPALSKASDEARQRHHGLRPHVRSDVAGVDGLLDTLLSRVVVVAGWEEGLDLVLAHPDLVAVTAEGDRFSSEGWRVGPSPLPTRAGLDDARCRAQEAGAVATAAEERVQPARAEAAGAVAALAQLAERREAAESRLRQSAEVVRELEEQRRAVTTERQGVEAHVQRENERVRSERNRVAQLEGLLPALEADESARAEQVRARQSARGRLDDRVAAVSTLRTDLEVRAAALEERRSLLSRRLGEVGERLLTLAQQQEAAERRRGQLEGMATATTRLGALVAARLSVVDARLEALHERRRRRQAAARAALERLERLRARRAASRRELEEVRDRGREAELEASGLRLRLEATADAVRRELGCAPADNISAPCPELPPGVSPEDRLRNLDQELRALGPVNALALEDHEALAERHAFIEGQLEDVRAARRELGKVVRAIDSEIADVFAAAFADVSENFSKLFVSLFPGGTAQLRLTDPDDLLATGIEVEARPSGKRVGKLSLLSGGERSLTALAFLFAVFRSRPSPFYLLDEVEAALDDVNLNRFLELVNEFRDEAQLVVVSHQKRTMEAADCLYGVTMQPGGSSRAVSERVGEGSASQPGAIGAGAASR